MFVKKLQCKINKNQLTQIKAKLDNNLWLKLIKNKELLIYKH